jgi:Zinc knuckle
MQHNSDTVYAEEVLYAGRLRTNVIRETAAMRSGATRGAARRPFRRYPHKDRSSIRCFKCSKMGHFANECPTKNDMGMVEAVRARVRHQGGDAKAVAETLYEMAAQSDFQDEIGNGDTISAGIFETLFEEIIQGIDEDEQNMPEDTPPPVNFD